MRSFNRNHCRKIDEAFSFIDNSICVFFWCLENMNHIRAFCSCNKRDTDVWKATSLVIGWFALIGSTWIIYEVLLAPANQSTIVSIIYTILVIFLNINQRICKHVTIALCGKFIFEQILLKNIFFLFDFSFTFNFTSNFTFFEILKLFDSFTKRNCNYSYSLANVRYVALWKC